jgi:tetratricopeptide (TPR) repeat protein
MIKKSFSCAFHCLLALSVFCFAGCSRKAKTNRHLVAAERAFAVDNYRAAEIEYLNVLRLDSTNSTAVTKLGAIYYAQDQLIKALPFLNSAKKYDPASLENRARAARVYLSLGAVKEAVSEAKEVLQTDPFNEAAILVLIDALANPKEALGTRQFVEALQKKAGDKAIFRAAFGYLAQIDGNNKLAEAEFRKGIELDPQSAIAHFGLGNLYFLQKKNPEAEQELKIASDFSPVRSARRLRLVELKLQSGEVDSAKKLLTEIQAKAPDYLPAWIFAGRIAFAEKKYPECGEAVDRVLVQNPKNYEALVLRSQLRLAEGKIEAGVADLEKLNEYFPRIPAARYQLAVAYLLNKDTSRAIAALSQAISVDQDYVPAILLLADLNVHRGDALEALRSMNALIAKHPGIEKAHSIRAAAFVAVGKLNEAIVEYKAMSQAFPKSKETPFLLGMTYRRQGKDAEARQSFEKALEIAPDQMPAIEQLAELDMRAKDFSSAAKRAQHEIEQFPKNAEPRFLLAKIYVAQNDRKDAEPILEKVIQMNPDAVGAYLLLAQIYVTEKKIEPALEKLRTALSKNPREIGSLLLTALIYSEKGDYEKAKDTYEQLLAVSPNSLISLNNLANIYAEKLKQLDKAYGMARKASELKPNDPILADTFGWILSQRGDYVQALTILRDSAQKMPANAEILSHVGITHYFLGQEDLARSALEQSLRLSTSFNGRPQVEQYLAILAINPAKADPKAASLLEDRLAEKPADPIAVSRLVAVFRQNGQIDRAIQVYERGLTANPNSGVFMVRLAELLAAQKRDGAKILELLRNARKVSPEDSTVARVAGRIAYTSTDLKDQQWALSLLQESNRKSTDDPALLFDLGLAYYSQGRIPEAQETLKRVLALDAPSNAQNAKQILEFIRLSDNPALAQQAQKEIRQALTAEPGFVPALVAQAVALQQYGVAAEAIKAWEQILARYPGFAPAIRSLAVMLADQNPKDPQTISLATRARELYPQDPEVAGALGAVKYYQGDFQYAARLLAESSKVSSGMAKPQYLLGMSYYQLKRFAESKAALKKGLALQPESPFAPEAKRLLAELK